MIIEHGQWVANAVGQGEATFDPLPQLIGRRILKTRHGLCLSAPTARAQGGRAARPGAEARPAPQAAPNADRPPPARRRAPPRPPPPRPAPRPMVYEVGESHGEAAHCPCCKPVLQAGGCWV